MIKKEKIKLNEINENENENKIIENEEKEQEQEIIQIEFSTGEKIQEEIKILTKYPNSMLAACINGKIKLPKRGGHYFFDRNYNDFKLLLFFLKKAKLPKFKNYTEEKMFFKEIEFWRIPLKINSNKILQFDLSYTPTCFNIDNKSINLTKKNNLHGIVLLNKSLTAISPFVEFSILINNPFCNNKRFYFGLVDKKVFLQKHINNSFEDGTAPFIFYWDIYKNKVIKNKNSGMKNWIEFEKPCQCFWNNYEIKFGMKYDQKNHSIKLYRNDIELNIEIKNIEPGMTPAIELHMEDCKIHLSQNNDNQEMFYL
jgi:hypothetical protein